MVAPRAAIAERFDATAVTGHPAVFRWVQMIPEQFVPALDKALAGSGHTMVVKGQYGGAIAGIGEELETIGSGLAELGICQVVFDPSKLALQNITYYTPFVSDEIDTVGQVIDELHQSDPRITAAYAENEVVYLGAPIVIDDYLLFTSFPVTSFADLRGRKIAAPGAAVNWLEGTGAVGVAGNLTTYYNELDTGVYEGVLVFASAAHPARLHEVAPHVTRVGLGAQFAAALCANRAWYEALPEELATALHTAAGEAGRWYRAELESAVPEALKAMQQAGATINEAPERFRRQWAASMNDAAGEWVEELERRGLPARALLRDYMSAMREAGATPLRDWSASASATR